MLELDAGASRAFGNESHLDFGAKFGIVAPVRADAPDQHDPGGLFPDEHASPIAFAAVLAALVPAPADARLENRSEPLARADVVRARPPFVLPGSKGTEHVIDRRVDRDALSHPNGSDFRVHHLLLRSRW